MKFRLYKQLDQMDCGPTCLKMISRYYGANYSLEYLRSISYATREGVSLLDISEAAEKIGFRSISVKVSFEELDKKAPLPCILHWRQNHFVVLPPQNYDSKRGNAKITIADPAEGYIKLDKASFLQHWAIEGNNGVALLLEPRGGFLNEDQDVQKRSRGFQFLLPYIHQYKRTVFQLLLCIIFASGISLIGPFLTQGLVDYGINHQNISFVYLVLISQLLLFVGATSIDLLRGWILLHLNSRINIAILSDFLAKMMKLPVRFFDTKQIGDLRQRIADHQRIQVFLSSNSLSTVFSLINLLIFSFVLGLYSTTILFVFLSFSIGAIGWIILYLRRRKHLDYLRFQRQAENEGSILELITGMQEIKLNSAETIKRWGWERVQAKIYSLNIRSLALGQYQQTGFMFLNQLKNILISFYSAKEVLSGEMSLGMMLSVSYIIGQMNSPLEQLLAFIQNAQDARLSLERLNEIHQREDEEAHFASNNTTALERNGDIKIKGVGFRYGGPHSQLVLDDVSLIIPKGKVTAIVGASGSGKTTLLKLLLQFYEPTEGNISVGGERLNRISPKQWRKQCGVVMQDGFIFSDTIARNIAVGDEFIDNERLADAISIANLSEFVNELPSSINTKIGASGNGLSGGQRQRVLIARAIYKNPRYLFFDEATSSLDANNERKIMNHLDEFFKGRTVVVIAHRLSTVKNADQIIVMDKGKIVEVGSHGELAMKKGIYYTLVKNQLELGN